MFLRKSKFDSWKDLQESVYFDDAKTEPVFDEKTAKSVYKLLQKKGGSQYPVVNRAIEDGLKKLGNTLPGIISGPISAAYNGASNIFTGAVDTIPFADIALELGKTGASIATVTIENIAGAFGGAPGEIVAFFLTFMIASAAASVHILERDFGGAIEQMLRALPIIGATLQTMLQKGELIVSKYEKNADKIKADFAMIMDKVKTVRENLTTQLQERPEFQQAKNMASERLAQARSRATEFYNREDVQNRLNQAKAKASELYNRPEIQKAKQLATDKFNQRFGTLRQNVALPNITAPAAGGKRFSTQRNTYSQWKKTRRQRFVKH
jgi:hypothetical protein